MPYDKSLLEIYYNHEAYLYLFVLNYTAKIYQQHFFPFFKSFGGNNLFF